MRTTPSDVRNLMLSLLSTMLLLSTMHNALSLPRTHCSPSSIHKQVSIRVSLEALEGARIASCCTNIAPLYRRESEVRDTRQVMKCGVTCSVRSLSSHGAQKFRYTILTYLIDCRSKLDSKIVYRVLFHLHPLFATTIVHASQGGLP